MLHAIKQTALFHGIKASYYACRNYHHRRCLTNYCKSIFYNKDVLLVGSGPSAKSISTIAPGTIVACCNFSPDAIETILAARKLDMYLTSKEALRSGGAVEKILDKYTVDYCIHNLPFSSRTFEGIKNQYFIPQDISILRHITSELSFKELQEIHKLGENTILSSGVQLLSYILCANPKSVTLAGIDTDYSVSYFDNLSYETDSKDTKKNNHYQMDKKFLIRVSKKYDNVFTVPESPLKNIFKSKVL